MPSVLTMSLRSPRRVAPRALTILMLAGVVSACDDDPFGLQDWTAAPDTVLLYSLARPELNLASAFNLDQRRLIRIEAPGSTGEWDFAVDTDGGSLVFLTPVFFGIDSEARIATFPGMSFDEVRRAPSDTAAYVADDPVPVDLGTVYVMRTNESVGSFGRLCSYYAKLEPLEVSVENGTVLFVYDSNPICNELDLVPPNGG